MKFANPAPLGLFGFAVTTWMLSMFNVGWFGLDTFPLMMSTAFAFGGTAQFIAGVLEYPRGNTFGFVAFCSYGAFWWAFALFLMVFGGKGPLTYLGAWLVVWAVFTAVLWFASLKLPKPRARPRPERRTRALGHSRPRAERCRPRALRPSAARSRRSSPLCASSVLR